jgi:predicted transcriptional regulator
MNWKNGIEKLIESGVSVKEIAEVSGLAPSTVYDLKNGYSIEPRGMAAVRIHEMIESMERQAA